jgi:hypothetical protein
MMRVDGAPPPTVVVRLTRREADDKWNFILHTDALACACISRTPGALK